MIPQTDPKAAYLAQQAEIDAAIRRVLEGGRYILGEEVSAFEAEFAAYAGAKQGVAVASGTDALILAFRALGLGPGDAVFTVSHTAVATVSAIELVGATPVLLDVDAYYGIDTAQLEKTLAAWPSGAAKLKAIVPVHLYGQAADMPAIAAIAGKYGLAIIEDGSQAHGARLGGIGIGHWGQLTAYSLYPTKNLGAIGDGGIITTEDAAVATRLKELREYGWRDRYVSAITGMNSRLDPLQAAILRVKLTRLKADTARRQAIAARYDAGLKNLDGISLPATRAGAEPVYHQYVIDVGAARRDAMREALTKAGVGTLIHYPVPIHLQPAYQGRVPLGVGGLARTEAAAKGILSLPMFPQLSDVQADAVVAAVRQSA
ncbi:MAG: DegT/DnrJ/EryC1/StrS family aminotransferase [Ferrovibrio sp.]|nr:DegT/DnrJ/EryC1/StrS family aminotransferase [Ferrovibrio sp.]